MFIWIRKVVLELLDSNNQEKNIWLTLEEFLFLRIMG